MALPAFASMFLGGLGGGGGETDIGKLLNQPVGSQADATSGASPVNVAINAPAQKELRADLIKGAAWFGGGLVLMVIASRLFRR